MITDVGGIMENASRFYNNSDIDLENGRMFIYTVDIDFYSSTSS